jgi:hypothetical protein
MRPAWIFCLSLAATALSSAASEGSHDTGVFSLLPKSLQKNPRLEFTVSGEVTAAGERTAPTQTQSVVCIVQPGKFVQSGVGGNASNGPAPSGLLELMTSSLAQRGYVVTADAKPAPAQLIVFNWGFSSYLPPSTVSDRTLEADVPLPGPALRRALLDRARLLGAEGFVREVSAALAESETRAFVQQPMTAPNGNGGFIGTITDPAPSPFDQLRMKSREHQRLVDDLFSSSYFVIASAYDASALAKGEHVLLWRTKMTVNATAADAVQAVPALIAAAGPYFGVATPIPVTVSRQVADAAFVGSAPLVSAEKH